MLSIQNEASAATNWDSCIWSGEQERKFLKENLYPNLILMHSESSGMHIPGKSTVFDVDPDQIDKLFFGTPAATADSRMISSVESLVERGDIFGLRICSIKSSAAVKPICSLG